MSARNRSSFSKSGGRRSGSATALRQGSFILFLIAFSFLMGFFVLSRFMHADRGPESQSATALTGNNNETLSRTKPGQTVTAMSPTVPTAPRMRPTPQSVAPSADTPGPSIEPADDEKTQKPSSIDEPSSSSDKPADQTSGDPESTDTKDVKASDASGVQDSGAIVSIEPGQSSTDTPRRPRRRRRRTPRAETKSNTDQKSAREEPTKEEPTQAPAKLDDSSDAGTKGDN